MERSPILGSGRVAARLRTPHDFKGLAWGEARGQGAENQYESVASPSWGRIPTVSQPVVVVSAEATIDSAKLPKYPPKYPKEYEETPITHTNNP